MLLTVELSLVYIIMYSRGQLGLQDSDSIARRTLCMYMYECEYVHWKTQTQLLAIIMGLYYLRKQRLISLQNVYINNKYFG